MTKHDIRLEISKLVHQLNYSQVKLKRLDIAKLRNWCYINLPKTVGIFKKNLFDLNEPSTWEEIAAYNTILQFYGKKVAIYFTFSWLDYNSVKEFLSSKKGEKFRKDFDIDCHSAILLSPTVFFDISSFDEFWVSFDFKKGYSFLDYSHYDENEDLDQNIEKWQWLNEALEEQESEKIPTKITSKKKNVSIK